MTSVVLVVSVDTEEDNWHPTRAGITTANLRAAPGFQRRMEALGVRPTWFVNHQVLANPRSADVIEGLHRAGTAEIGVHIHPWNTPPLEEALSPANTMLLNLPPALQRRKIETAVQAVTDVCGGVRPVAFRAGRWGLGPETLAALESLQMRVDSSVTPNLTWEPELGPSFVGAPSGVYPISSARGPNVPDPAGTIMEVPVSVGFNRRPYGLWRRASSALEAPVARRLHLRGLASRAGLIRRIILSPETSEATDMVAVGRAMVADGFRMLHVFLHSPSLVPGLTPFARRQADVDRIQDRLEVLVTRLSAHLNLRCMTVSEAAAALAPTA